MWLKKFLVHGFADAGVMRYALRGRSGAGVPPQNRPPGDPLAPPPPGARGGVGWRRRPFLLFPAWALGHGAGACAMWYGRQPRSPRKQPTIRETSVLRIVETGCSVSSGTKPNQYLLDALICWGLAGLPIGLYHRMKGLDRSVSSLYWRAGKTMQHGSCSTDRASSRANQERQRARQRGGDPAWHPGEGGALGRFYATSEKANIICSSPENFFRKNFFCLPS